MHSPAPALMPLLDELLAFETDAMRLLRINGPIARRLNEEAARDKGEDE
jgi:hypothetical protein